MQPSGRSPDHYPTVSIDDHVIMPDHVHILLALQNVDADGRQIAAPTSVSTVVQQLKRAVSRKIGHSIWERSFYDHIIRNDADLAAARTYVQGDPATTIDKD